jgi:GNAT superfamily N-acetyltransferase
MASVRNGGHDPMLIRRAQGSDASAIARVSVDTWRSAYRGIVPEQYLASLSYDDRAEGVRSTLAAPDAETCCFVAEDEGDAVVGFAWGGPRREGEKRYVGELYAIYVLGERQRAGAGRALIRAVAEDLLRRSMRSMLVWVLAVNPSRHFYEALGGKPAGQTEIEIGGAVLVEVAYGWDDVASLLAPASDS